MSIRIQIWEGKGGINLLTSTSTVRSIRKASRMTSLPLSLPLSNRLTTMRDFLWGYPLIVGQGLPIISTLEIRGPMNMTTHINRTLGHMSTVNHINRTFLAINRVLQCIRKVKFQIPTRNLNFKKIINKRYSVLLILID